MKTTTPTLSKSAFVKGSQCAKALYLYKKHPELIEVDEAALQIMEQGTNVGLLAQKRFPKGIDVSPDKTGGFKESLALTKKLINEGQSVIYEAMFQSKGIMCIIDILENKKGKWYAYEVKSSTEVKDYHYTDTAFQYHVITKSGLALEDISVMHINNKYSRKGDLDLKKLFSIASVKEEAKAKTKEVEKKIKELHKVLKDEKIPEQKIGKHCFKPFDCEFYNYCWNPLGIDEKIMNLYSKDLYHCIDEGIYTYDKIPEDYKLDKRSTKKLDKLDTKEIYKEKKQIKDFLKTFKSPFYYFDFETYQMPVPDFDNARPYQMIPFQYSLHVKNKTKITHHEFLGDGTSDPRETLIQQMIKELGTKGSIIAYNQTFEVTRLKELAKNFPKYKDKIEAIIERFVDLMVPFQKGWYYHPNFKTSYSIKYVLPALIPELSYKELGIQNGGEASSAYPLLSTMEATEKAQTRKDLLEYCKLDTLAMVKIHEHLEKEIYG